MRILACIDLSPISDRVAIEAAALARATGAELTLLHGVRTEPVLTTSGVSSPLGHRVPPVDLAERRAKMSAMTERLSSEGLRVSSDVKLVDDVLPGLVIREAEAVGASYIVLGSHGHGRMFELVLGSVTSAVVRDSRIPVVVVPPHSGEPRKP